MSDLEEHLEEEVAPVPASLKRLSCPSQDMEYMPEILRGSAFHEEVIRYSSNCVDIPNMNSETEIVHVGRTSQNECAVIMVIGTRSQKALWDLCAGRCIISYDCYNSLHPKYKT